MKVFFAAIVAAIAVAVTGSAVAYEHEVYSSNVSAQPVIKFEAYRLPPNTLYKVAYRVVDEEGNYGYVSSQHAVSSLNGYLASDIRLAFFAWTLRPCEEYEIHAWLIPGNATAAQFFDYQYDAEGKKLYAVTEYYTDCD